MKKILYIDMDGVIANFDKAISNFLPELDTRDGPNYEERSKQVDKICLENPRIFRDLELIENAKIAIQLLFESNKFEIYFLSTPMWCIPECFMDKRLWLEEHFGEIVKNRLILTKRKDLNIGDYLIDDTIRNGVLDFKGEHIHFGSKEFPIWFSVLSYLLDNEK